ncbi:MAG: HpcH/HpaI aldolase family protein [Microbacteriaceae bacterium]|jgi:2-keto-3-deoxy-L-rhamnonate aldolase RhmA|nr:HpcH/HpaI aldolase family protein [Microbacteriaceae bacterium]
MVRTAADVLTMRDALLYPPNGTRGICPAYRVAGYSLRTFSEYASASDAGLLLIPMIETIEALEHVEEICAIDEVRIIVFAAGELSYALGEGANVNLHGSDKIQEALLRVKAAAKAHNIALLGPHHQPHRRGLRNRPSGGHRRAVPRHRCDVVPKDLRRRGDSRERCSGWQRSLHAPRRTD